MVVRISGYRALVYRDRARFALFYQEYQWNHQQYGDGQKPEVVEVGEHGGLALNCVLNHRPRYSRGSGWTTPLRLHQRAQSF